MVGVLGIIVLSLTARGRNKFTGGWILPRQLQQQLHQQEEDRGMVWSREVEPEQDRVEQEQSERQENESAVRQQLPPSQKNGHVASEVVENGRRGQGPSQVA
uniref:(northern house mosquito) hypothetical protein n=1 Tax=Culex pipiens TaxID=7175 RepID=A0A8D8G8Q8_CULPI